MLETLKGNLSPELSLKILEFITTIIIAYITAKITAKNAKKTLTTQYFKDEGVKTQESVLKFWCALLLNNFDIQTAYKKAFNPTKSIKKSDADILIELHEESYIYCSSKTISAIKDYLQHLYKEDSINDASDNHNSKNPFKFLKKLINKANVTTNFVLITRIISRMKYDFTGEKVDELNILMIKINDITISFKILFRIKLWLYNIKENIQKILILLLAILITFYLYKKHFQ